MTIFTWKRLFHVFLYSFKWVFWLDPFVTYFACIKNDFHDLNQCDHPLFVFLKSRNHISQFLAILSSKNHTWLAFSLHELQTWSFKSLFLKTLDDNIYIEKAFYLHAQIEQYNFLSITLGFPIKTGQFFQWNDRKIIQHLLCMMREKMISKDFLCLLDGQK